MADAAHSMSKKMYVIIIILESDIHFKPNLLVFGTSHTEMIPKAPRVLIRITFQIHRTHVNPK